MAQWAKSLGFCRFLCGLLGVLWASGPVFAQNISDSNVKNRPVAGVSEALVTPRADISPGMAGSFLSGRFAKQNKDLREAARYLSETLAHDPNNEPLQLETMRMQLLAGDVPRATELAHQLEKTQGSDPLVASLLMLEAVKSGNAATAKAALERGASGGLFGLIRPIMLQWLAMDESTKKVCEDILREKIHSLQSDYEQKVSFLTRFFEEAMAQLQANEVAKREQLVAEHQQELDKLQKEYCQKTKDLEEEINFLNERHDSQRLMLHDTFHYVQKLEEELKQLKTIIASGDHPGC